MPQIKPNKAQRKERLKARSRAFAKARETPQEFDDNWNSIPQNVKLRLEQFSREYIKDFNGANAIRRMGYKSKQPAIRGSEWFREPYTQWFLAKLVRELDERAIVTKNDVLIGLLREANQYGLDSSGSARISAWRALAKILGIEVTKVEGNVSVNGGVMVVPFSESAKEWEENSKAQQAELKKKVRQ